ncbi:MAG: isochorismatase family protein [Pseudomonadota bacterium]
MSSTTDLQRIGRDTAIVCGMEAHICVTQTVLVLVSEGNHVLLVADAVGSSTNANRTFAIDRMSEDGA